MVSFLVRDAETAGKQAGTNALRVTVGISRNWRLRDWMLVYVAYHATATSCMVTDAEASHAGELSVYTACVFMTSDL